MRMGIMGVQICIQHYLEDMCPIRHLHLVITKTPILRPCWGQPLLIQVLIMTFMGCKLPLSLHLQDLLMVIWILLMVFSILTQTLLNGLMPKRS